MIDKKLNLIKLNFAVSELLKTKTGEGFSLKNKVLFLLESCGGNATTKQIMEEIKIAKTNLATILAELEQDGMIEKKKTKTDARSIKINITKLGSKQISGFADLFEDNLMTDIGKKRYKELCLYAEKINKILDRQGK